MSEKRNLRLDERIERERISQHRLVGFLLFPIALFPLLSLMTYDWHDISWLTVPPLNPPANLIGVVGAWFAFSGYTLIGLAIWIVPVLALIFSAMLMYGRIMRVGRRALWMSLFIVSLSCLAQLGSESVFQDLLQKLNLRPNAGGAIGYWLMDCFFARWFSPFGGGVLVMSFLCFSLVMAVGGSLLWQIPKACWRLLCTMASFCRGGAEGPSDSDVVSGGLSPEEVEKAKDEVRKAREAAKEERRRAKELAKEQKRQEREAKRAASMDAQQQMRQERLRARQEEARRQQLEKQEEDQRRDKARALAEQARRDALRISSSVPVPSSPVPSVEGGKSATLSTVTPEKPAKKTVPSIPVPPDTADSGRGGDSDAFPPYDLPPLSLLDDVRHGGADSGDTQFLAKTLEETLARFNATSEVVAVTTGPVVTQYELRPSPDVRVDKFYGLRKTVQMALAAESLRLLAPIPGKNAIGIEIPNKRAVPVTFGEVMRGDAFRKHKVELPLVLGKDVGGHDLIADLAKAPHLLVAGATGAGKSVCLNSIIIGLLMSRTPEQLRLILVDPKCVEFTSYNDIPHLLVPVINDSKKVAFGLRWAVQEMKKRYQLLKRHHCRNIVAYNNRGLQQELFPMEESPDPKTLPYIVIIVDEVADIMASDGKTVEPAIDHLARLSRAVGIHLILATQRPSTDVITGTIKANIPGRIAFKVAQSIDSRTILDATGAEELLGKGDMLFLKNGSDLIRAQGCWLSDEEINRVVAYIKEHNQPQYDQALSGKLETIEDDKEEDILSDPPPEPEETVTEEVDRDDEIIRSALELIRRTKRVSTTMIQTRLRIGYSRASRIVSTLEERGIISPPQGASGQREILVDLDELLPPEIDEGMEQEPSSNSAESNDPTEMVELPDIPFEEENQSGEEEK